MKNDLHILMKRANDFKLKFDQFDFSVFSNTTLSDFKSFFNSSIEKIDCEFGERFPFDVESKTEDPTKWDLRFISIVKEIQSWSKDTTKIGAIFVKDQHLISSGYNGFPKAIADTPEDYLDRKYKTSNVIHAEKNAIYNAKRFNQDIRGSVCYVYGLPVCNECAKALIQVETTKVFSILKPDQKLPARWNCSFIEAEEKFKRAGIEYSVLIDTSDK